MGKVVKKFRFITVDQFEKEQDYLRAMSAKGLHFTGYKFPFYKFEVGDAKPYQYQVDFQSLASDNRNSYLQLFKDDGWELVLEYPGVYGSWYYFRKEVTGDQQTLPQIFTDAQSKIALYQKIRRNWAIFIVSLLPVIVAVLTTSGINGGSFLTYAVLGLWLIVALIYVKLLINLTLKINQLRRDE